MHDDRGELRRVERNVVRIVVLDTANHVLLLQTRDLGKQPGVRHLMGAPRWGDGSMGRHTEKLQ